ncbi:DUF1364 domain-containing protein [Budvicia aquatica]|uniref:DUF1364 domain-containing protein n=1 Tax=Budvicia aquatica TaxID=82979 RepID=UPI00207EDEFF|nr:DUF1364 domain-containing protein [Budvicia aquatica]GKX50589.1 hypothetical protein SOASR029_08980 [Budvicia aquatica]
MASLIERGGRPKQQAMRSSKLRNSAKGQLCTLQIPGICNHNPETVVLCHLPSENHGMGYKSDDFWAVYGCSSCHDVIDGRRAYQWRHGEKERCFLAALYQTLKHGILNKL